MDQGVQPPSWALGLKPQIYLPVQMLSGCGWGTEMEYAVPVVLVGFIALDALVIWLLAG